VPDSEIDNRWLGPVLRRGLERVPAPHGLWDRIVLPRMEVGPSSNYRFIWILAAASAFMLSVLTMARGYHLGHSGNDGLGIRMQLASANVSEIRTWVRNRTGLDLPLRNPSSAAVRMVGASVQEGGDVEVRFRAANQDAVMTVSRSRREFPDHTYISGKSVANLKTISWSAADGAYTLALHSDDLRAACLVCHADSTL
jgi:hypothetical protein